MPSGKWARMEFKAFVFASFAVLAIGASAFARKPKASTSKSQAVLTQKASALEALFTARKVPDQTESGFQKCFSDPKNVKASLNGLKQFQDGKHYFTDAALQGVESDLKKALQKPCEDVAKGPNAADRKECCLYAFSRLHNEFQFEMDKLALDAAGSKDPCVSDYALGRSFTSDCADCAKLLPDDACSGNSVAEGAASSSVVLHELKTKHLKDGKIPLQDPSNRMCFVMGFVTKRLEYCEGLQNIFALNAAHAIQKQGSGEFSYEREFCEKKPKSQTGGGEGRSDESAVRSKGTMPVRSQFDLTDRFASFDQTHYSSGLDQPAELSQKANPGVNENQDKPLVDWTVHWSPPVVKAVKSE